jgi:hypothetical protein
MSLLGVPSQWALDKGFIEVLEEVGTKVTRVAVSSTTIILVLNMPKEHGQQIMVLSLKWLGFLGHSRHSIDSSRTSSSILLDLERTCFGTKQ